MALIMFVVGAYLYYSSRFSFGSVRTQGRHVRAAGLVLMFPAGFTFLFSLFAGLVFGSSLEALVLIFNIMALFELVSMVVAGVVAYILIANPANAPRLPGFLGDIQRERQEGAPQQPAARAAPRVTIERAQPAAPQPRTPAPEQFPSILTVAQAARYLQVSEADVVDLIESGKLAAARINYNYRIAKSNLDELLLARETAVTGK